MIGALGGIHLVSEAMDADTNDGDFIIFDTTTAEAIHYVDARIHVGFRALTVDADGQVLD